MDIKYDTLKGSGPGGQHRNKRMTAVRATHVATGISVVASDSKSQAQNKKAATRRLMHKIKMLDMVKKQRKLHGAPATRVRTYNALRNTVKDERVQNSTFSYANVLFGDGLDDIITILWTQQN